jgi:hypothetical protein
VPGEQRAKAREERRLTATSLVEGAALGVGNGGAERQLRARALAAIGQDHDHRLVDADDVLAVITAWTAHTHIMAAPRCASRERTTLR